MQWALVNVVAAGVADKPLDLGVISKRIKGTSYNPRRFPGATIRITNPKTSFLLFKSGRVVAVGMKDMDTVDERFDILRDMLADIGIQVSFSNCKVVNSVAVLKIQRWIDIDKLYLTLLEDEVVCPQFDYEIYPTLYARIGNCTVIVATRHTDSGGVTSLNALGGASVKDIEYSLDTVVTILDKGGFI